MDLSLPMLDGVAPSWADISVKVVGTGIPLLEMKDIAAINTGTSLEVGEQRNGGCVIRRTTGSASYEASMTLYRSGYQSFLRSLMQLAPFRGSQRVLSAVNFEILVQHTPVISLTGIPDPNIYIYVIKGCRYTGRGLNGAEGSEADKVEVALNTIQIVDIIDGQETVLL